MRVVRHHAWCNQKREANNLGWHPIPQARDYSPGEILYIISPYLFAKVERHLGVQCLKIQLSSPEHVEIEQNNVVSDEVLITDFVTKIIQSNPH